MDDSALVITCRSAEDGTRVEVTGEADSSNIIPMRDILLRAVENSRCSQIILDLTELDYIDSSGLGVIMEAVRKLSRESRMLQIRFRPGKQPERVLRISRFDQIKNVDILPMD